jgi:hypothetical protein
MAIADRLLGLAPGRADLRALSLIMRAAAFILLFVQAKLRTKHGHHGRHGRGAFERAATPITIGASISRRNCMMIRAGVIQPNEASAIFLPCPHGSLASTSKLVSNKRLQVSHWGRAVGRLATKLLLRA